MAKPSELLAGAPAASEPIPVYTGPARTGTALIAAIAADTEKQTSRHRKPRVAAKKPAAIVAATSKKDARPAAVKHANASPKVAEKPVGKLAKPKKPST
jgi:D-alanyl-D-alanine carboxypeptidase